MVCNNLTSDQVKDLCILFNVLYTLVMKYYSLFYRSTIVYSRYKFSDVYLALLARKLYLDFPCGMFPSLM